MSNKFFIFIFLLISCTSNHNKTHSFISAQVISLPTEVYSEWGKLNTGEKFENRFLGLTVNYLDSMGNSQNAIIVFPSTKRDDPKLPKVGEKVKIPNALITKYFLPIKTPNVNIDEIGKLE